jgi:hypothetical protein
VCQSPLQVNSKLAARSSLHPTGLFRHLLTERSLPIPPRSARARSFRALIRAAHFPRNPRSPTAKAIDGLTSSSPDGWREPPIESRQSRERRPRRPASPSTQGACRLGGALVLDLQLPGPCGLEPQARTKELGRDVPSIFISGRRSFPPRAGAGGGEALPRPGREPGLTLRPAPGAARPRSPREAHPR